MCTNLEVLNIHGNGISDDDISKLGVFKNLKSLNIGRNHITIKGIEELVKTGLKLTTLGISEINIRNNGAISKLKELKMLEELDVSWCNIKDVGAEEIAKNLSNIKRIHLNGNNITNRWIRSHT